MFESQKNPVARIWLSCP